MGNRGLQINPVGVLASCGLGLNLVWCTLMGHTLGFMSSTAGMDAWANPRLFFLAGIGIYIYEHLSAVRRCAVKFIAIKLVCACGRHYGK